MENTRYEVARVRVAHKMPQFCRTLQHVRVLDKQTRRIVWSGHKLWIDGRRGTSGPQAILIGNDYAEAQGVVASLMTNS